MRSTLRKFLRPNYLQKINPRETKVFFRFNSDFKRGLKSLWTPFLAPTNASGFYIIYALHVVFVWERGFSSSQPFPSGYLNDFFCNEVTLDCHLVSPATRAVLTSSSSCNFDGKQNSLAQCQFLFIYAIYDLKPELSIGWELAK